MCYKAYNSDWLRICGDFTLERLRHLGLFIRAEASAKGRWKKEIKEWKERWNGIRLGRSPPPPGTKIQKVRRLGGCDGMTLICADRK